MSGGLLTILEKLKVKNIIISKQGKQSSNFKKLIEIVGRKNVNILVVQAGEKIVIDKDTHFDVLFPTSELISANILNNNSIVAKFCMQNNAKQIIFSMLFTGDVEQIAEEKIVELYQNELEVDILKVAHHGSKTSSTNQLLQLVKPKIALIGVGEGNNFGHPSQITLDNLENLRLSNL